MSLKMYEIDPHTYCYVFVILAHSKEEALEKFKKKLKTFTYREMLKHCAKLRKSDGDKLFFSKQYIEMWENATVDNLPKKNGYKFVINEYDIDDMVGHPRVFLGLK